MSQFQKHERGPIGREFTSLSNRLDLHRAARALVCGADASTSESGRFHSGSASYSSTRSVGGEGAGWEGGGTCGCVRANRVRARHDVCAQATPHQEKEGGGGGGEAEDERPRKHRYKKRGRLRSNAKTPHRIIAPYTKTKPREKRGKSRDEDATTVNETEERCDDITRHEPEAGCDGAPRKQAAVAAATQLNTRPLTPNPKPLTQP